MLLKPGYITPYSTTYFKSASQGLKMYFHFIYFFFLLCFLIFFSFFFSVFVKCSHVGIIYVMCQICMYFVHFPCFLLYALMTLLSMQLQRGLL